MRKFFISGKKRIHVDKAIELHAQGKSWREIGRILKVHPYSISYKLKKMGYDTNRRVGRTNIIDSDEVIKLREEGHTHNTIAQILGCSESAIQRILKKKEKEEKR